MKVLRNGRHRAARAAKDFLTHLSYNSLKCQVNSSKSGEYGWNDLWGGHWGMQHYTEQTWDPKVIEAISAFVIIREVPAYQDK